MNKLDLKEIFNEDMGTSEARYMFFKLMTESESPEEKEIIKDFYKNIWPKIIKREFKENAGYCTG